MDFDDWFMDPARGPEIAALLDRVRRETRDDPDDAEGLLIYYAFQMAWTAATEQGSAGPGGPLQSKRH